MERYMGTTTHEQLVDAIANYEVPRDTVEFVSEHPPTIICGITSAGKDTVAHELVRQGGYEIVVSHTTRQPRVNHGQLEQEGIDYHFVDEAEMLRLVQSKSFFEVKEVHGQVYGTSLGALELPYEHGNQAILVIDFQGALEFVTFIPDLRPVFLLPPSLEVWRGRLNGRGELSAEEFHKRLTSASREVATALDNPSFQLLVNYEKEDTAETIRQNAVGRDHSAVDVADQLLFDIKTELARAA